MRMAPLHVKRKIWWELIFAGVLLYLFVGVRTEKKRDVAAAAQIARTAMVAEARIHPVVAMAQAALAPALQLGAVLPPQVAPLALP